MIRYAPLPDPDAKVRGNDDDRKKDCSNGANSSSLLLADGDKCIDLRRIRRIIRWIENKLPEVL